MTKIKPGNSDDFYLVKNRIRAIIETLEAAISYGFRTRSSPLDPLLQSMIDISLQLSLFFNEGGWLQAPKNKGLRFGDSYQDDAGVWRADSSVLGNPRQIRINFPGVKLQPSEGFSDFFADLAYELANLARGIKPESKILKRFNSLIARYRKPHKGPTKINNYFYHRRTHLKKKSN